MEIATPPETHDAGIAITDTGCQLYVGATGAYVLRDELRLPDVYLSWEEYDDEGEQIGASQFNLAPDQADRLSRLLAEAAADAREMTK